MLFMWLMFCIFLIVVIYLCIKLTPTRREREEAKMANSRAEASRRILAAEKNLYKVFPQNKTIKPQSEPRSSKKKVKEKLSVRDAEIEIYYEDAKGDITQREIRVMTYIVRTGRITAWCHLRNGLRTFYIDRIISAVDINTGEIINDIDLYLADHIG